jgi:putative two-component system hydrogenase maturation factor HypX/HoxX
MRILFLTRSFNSLAQRLYLDLSALGHELAVELDIADSVAEEAVALFRPALVIAPFLKRAIPESVWRHTPCLIVHPGIVGDRGPSALDWAITRGLPEWGVTVLQAQAEMDAGPVWAAERFVMRQATKSSLYRNEVTEAASRAVCRAVSHFAATGQAPAFEDSGARGRWQPLMRPPDRRIDWQHDDTDLVLRKLQAADGVPGVPDELFGLPCQLFDAHAESGWPPGQAAAKPGQVVARRQHAVLRATRDAAVWIGHARRTDQADGFKLPVSQLFPGETLRLPAWDLPLDAPAAAGWRDIRYEGHASVGVLHFPFYNGAMGTRQCERLDEALRWALAQPPRVLLLLGGTDFWSNGIHLNLIEAADSPADESWRNINAIDDLTLTLIQATGHLVLAGLQGNAGAGGVFMALAADRVWTRSGVVLNPHYKNMGNLHGSEYWTYLLPRRLGARPSAWVMDHRLPMSAAQAAGRGLVDAVFGDTAAEFAHQALVRAQALAADPALDDWLRAKQARRLADEASRPLAAYRADELGRMRRNFYGFDPSYHIARSNFVRRVPPSWTPRHLAVHRHAGAGN